MGDGRVLVEEFLPLERDKPFIGREPGKGVNTFFHICNKPFTEILAGQPLKSSSRLSGTNPSPLRRSATIETFVPGDRVLMANWELPAVARACRSTRRLIAGSRSARSLIARRLITMIQLMNGTPSLRSPT